LGARHEILQHEARGLAGQSERQSLHPRAGAHRVRVEAWAGGLRYGQDQPHGTHRMKLSRELLISCSKKLPLILGVALLFSASAPAPADSPNVFVTAGASALVTEGLAAAAPTGAAADAFQEVPSPGLRFVANVAQATSAPWIDSNAWRFHRVLRKANYSKLNAGAGPL